MVTRNRLRSALTAIGLYIPAALRSAAVRPGFFCKQETVCAPVSWSACQSRRAALPRPRVLGYGLPTLANPEEPHGCCQEQARGGTRHPPRGGGKTRESGRGP